MISTFGIVVVAAVIASTTGAAYAQTPRKGAAVCTEEKMKAADNMFMKMADGDNKTAAMQSLTSAKASMSQNDMAGCQKHLDQAMKMSKAKPAKAKKA